MDIFGVMRLNIYQGEGSFQTIIQRLLPYSVCKFSMVTIISEEVLTYKKKKFIIIKNVLLMRYIKIQVAQSMKFQKY